MLELVEMRYAGISKILKVFGKKAIDYNDCGGYELIKAVNRERYEELGSQISRLNKKLSRITGHRQTYSFADRKISRFGFRDVAHLVHTKKEGSLHPGKLCLCLLRKVQAMGVIVLPATEITHFESAKAA